MLCSTAPRSKGDLPKGTPVHVCSEGPSQALGPSGRAEPSARPLRQGRARRGFSGNWFLPVSGVGSAHPLLIEIRMDSWRRIRAASGRCRTGFEHVTRSHDALYQLGRKFSLFGADSLCMVNRVACNLWRMSLRSANTRYARIDMFGTFASLRREHVDCLGRLRIVSSG